MTIQVNTDRNTPGSESLNEFVSNAVHGELSHMADHITRVEVHIADENGGKTGSNDKKCTVEARLEHRKPVAVTSHADSFEGAISSAMDKMKSTLETTMGKIQSH